MPVQSYSLRSYEDEFSWVHENQEKLLNEYANKWIGVQGHRVIASAPDLDTLLSELPDPAHTAIELITPEHMEIIL